ncbi:hypothetical protein CAEBREN_01098 [Caenorhabditis brenneri]|uniref:Uncharacterized protein n=1 Tax=Caenorhabditis brenneri TaxID=135651 RepID=G0MD56_CAEBE|nr:hypothetical protein CAEBREN_01098 [Caenorhabditis brenneri]
MESPDRLQCRTYMVATLLRQMVLAPEFFEQVMKVGSWNPERAIGSAGVGDLAAPTALNPLTELFSAVEQARFQLSRSNPMAVQLLKNLGVNFYGLVVNSQPDLLSQDAASGENTIPDAPKVPQVTLDAIEIIGRLLLDARGMLMHRKNCPINICGQRAPVALQHHGEGPFLAIVPAAIRPPQLTPFTMAVADFFGATNVNQQSWTERDFEPIRRILMEYVLRENGNLRDMGAEIAQPAEPPVGTKKPEAFNAAPVQFGRRRAQSAPPGLLNESSAVQVVQPIGDVRGSFPTASVDAAPASPGKSASGATSPTATTASVGTAQKCPGEYARGTDSPSARGTSPEVQGSSEGSKTLTSRVSTSVSQQGTSDIGKLGEATGLPVNNESTGSTRDANVIPSSSYSSKKPLSQKDLGLTKVDCKVDGSSLQNKAKDGGTISLPVVGAPIDQEEDAKGFGTDPIDVDLPPADVEPAANLGKPMEIDQDDQNKVDGSTELMADSSTLNDPKSAAVMIPASSEKPVSQKVPGITMENLKEDGADHQKMAESAGPISSPRDGASINHDEVARRSGTVAIDGEGSLTGIGQAAHHEMPMEVEQEDRNIFNESPILDSVTDTTIQNGGTGGSGGSGNATIGDKRSPAGIESVADHATPMEIDQDDQNRAKAPNVPIAVTDTVLQSGSGTSSSFPVRGLPVPGSPIPLLPTHVLPAQTQGSAPLADQAPTERRKQCKTRRYTPGPPPPSEHDATVQANTRKLGRPRKHCPPPASGSSRAGQVSRSRSPPARQASHPLPTYQKIVKDREARFQKKKTIFLATRGAEHHPGSEVHDRKIAEAEMHSSESEVYNHPKLKQIMPHIHTLLFDLNSAEPLPQVKTVKEVKADELFWKWNLEVNGEVDKFEWKELIRKKDPAYEEWWGLAVKVDKEQLEQMELGWITGTAKDFGIGEEEDVAGPSGRDYREFSPEL